MSEDATRVIVRAGELQALLNALHAERNFLAVGYPFFDTDLFTYDPSKGAVVRAVNAEDFDAARNARLPKPQRLQDDLPAWTDVGDALLAAGVVPWRNMDEAREVMARESGNLKQAQNPNPAYLAFDTNAFYARLLREDAHHDLFPPGFGGHQLVVSEGVVDELMGAATRKYGDGDVSAFHAKLADGRRARGLLNRPTKKARTAKAGLGDLQRLRKTHRVADAACETLGEDAEENDVRIAVSYREFRKTVHADAMLVTADNGMLHHAQAGGLKTLFLEKPRVDAFPVGALREDMVCRLLHDLCVRFGVLHFKGLDVRVWGDWSGKTPDDWAAECLLVECAGRSKAVRTFLADVDAARAVEHAARSV